MDSDSPRLNDPEISIKRHAIKCCQKLSDQALQQWQIRVARNPNHDDARGSNRAKARDISKVQVKRHQASLLSNTYLEKPEIVCALQCFLTNRLYIVARRLEDMLSARPKILIEFELHAGTAIGIST